MKARVIWKGNQKENSAMVYEIKKQIAQRMKNHEDNVDSMVMYVLHNSFGFGKIRLRKFYEEYMKSYKELTEYYEMPEDFEYLCKIKLKEIGVDVEKWNDETFGEDRGDKVEVKRK